MTLRTRCLLLAVPALATLIAVSLSLTSGGAGRAAQGPRISLDMAPAGNAYDENTNTMTVGPIDNCLTTSAPGNNAQHNHGVHLIIQDVQDLTGWQVRLNYDGGRIRPAAVNVTPFTDGIRGQNIAFTNLPIDPASGVHGDIIPVSDIPQPAAGPQTALIGAAKVGEGSAAAFADTPPKSPPDDTSYSAPSGGILAAINLQILAGQAGQSALAIDLDDANPNAPGSKVVVFDGTGGRDINLEEAALGDGFHAEGAACVPPVTVPPTPPPDGAPGSPGTSPGASPGVSPGASPGTGASGSPGAASPSRTAAAGGEDGGSDGAGGDGDGGSSAWVYILIAVLLAAAAAGALAAWRFRDRIPWLRR